MAGTILLNATRSTDVIGRLGGDEFCVVAFSRSPNDAEIEALRLHAQLTEALSKFTPVGASIGVAFFDEAELSATEMIQKADEIMYSVKKAGKGSVLVKVV
jgi:diguanylate cyclase (GGDEF)-like protein